MIEIHFVLNYLQLYLLFMTFASFALYGYDKFLALQNLKNISRVSEFHLLLSSFFGGTPGSILAMMLFRHKVKKKSFLLKFAFVILLQAIFIYLYIYDFKISQITLGM
jgi:uncharacterized membrane protein YsdA (DUF1294 family)